MTAVPGSIATPLTRPLRDDPAPSAQILGRTPLGRWSGPDEIAGAALFLASPAARFATGTSSWTAAISRSDGRRRSS